MGNTVYKFDKRERKVNNVKLELVSQIAEFLTNDSENEIFDVNITKKEREIDFKFGENEYTLALIQHRKNKG